MTLDARRFGAAVLSVTLIFHGGVMAQSSSAPTRLPSTSVSLKERPKIGLVLSGGGARGLAHVGVLKVLERERIPAI